MSKRYVDSDQFIDPWFRRLSPHAKLYWTFLCASCDPSGVWERDDDYCKYLTGMKNSPDTLIEELGDRVVTLHDGKLLIPKFILFQQGSTLYEAKPPHRGILKLLDKHGLEMDEDGITKPILNLSLSKALPKTNQELTKPLVTSNSNGKGIVENKEGGKGETISRHPPQLDDFAFLSAWDDWIAYRKERSLPPYKPLGLQAQRTRLSGWVDDHGMKSVIDCIRSSIGNNYNGIHEPRPKTRSNFSNDDKPEPDRDYDNALG